jgi:Na+/melibiose symporter-like transporter
VGLILSGLGLSGVMFGSEMIGRNVMPAWGIMCFVGAGVVACWAYVVHAKRRPDPLLDLSLLQVPTFSVSVVAGSLFRFGVGAIPFLLPMMIQLGFGRSAAQSGLITFASAIGAVAMKPAAQRALRWLGFRRTLFWNAVASAGGVAMCAAFRPWWPVALIYAVLIVSGFLRSLQFTAYNTVAYADIARPRMSAATSLYSTIQQLSVTFGITVGAGTLALSSAMSGGGVKISDFSVAFLVVAFLMLVAAPASLLMPPDAGAEMSGHRHG